MKGAGILVVSLRGVNLVSFRVARKEIQKNYIFAIRFICAIHVIKI